MVITQGYQFVNELKRALSLQATYFRINHYYESDLFEYYTLVNNLTCSTCKLQASVECSENFNKNAKCELVIKICRWKSFNQKKTYLTSTDRILCFNRSNLGGNEPQHFGEKIVTRSDLLRRVGCRSSVVGRSIFERNVSRVSYLVPNRFSCHLVPG